MATQNSLLSVNPNNNSGVYTGRNSFFDDYLLNNISVSQPITVTAIATAPASFDPLLQVFEADPAGNITKQIPLVLNDDVTPGSNKNAQLIFTPTLGVANYILRLSTLDKNKVGNYSLSADQTGAAPVLTYFPGPNRSVAGGDTLPAIFTFSLNPGAPEAAQPNGLPPFSTFGPITFEGVPYLFYDLSDDANSIALSNLPDANSKLIRALNGDDNIQGTGNPDNVNGNKGNDIIDGLDGGDILRGGKDFDRVIGGSGSDKLNGNNENDTVEGGEGNDTVRGGKNDDVLTGNSGEDWLIGDLGQDSLTGGDGRDTFVLRSDTDPSTGISNTSPQVTQVDIISDFDISTVNGDFIGLTNNLKFSALIFEGIQTTINGTARPATALKITSTGDYLGIVLNVAPDDLKDAALYRDVDPASAALLV